MIEQLSHWDTQLFILLNKDLANSFFDSIMPVATDLHKEPWFVFTVFPMVGSLWIYFGRMNALKVIAGFCVVIAFTDNINNRLLKPYFHRERPPAVLNEDDFVLRTNRFAGFGFPSNHAANNFAGATFVSLVYPWVTPIAFFIAFFVSYSRIYVGVHFPLDVIFGALWASAFAYIFYHAWRRAFQFDDRKQVY